MVDNLDKRWKQFHENYVKRDEQVKVILEGLDIESVMDLGSGNQNLQPYFESKDIKYSPVDIKQRYPNTLVANFNNGEFPLIDTDLSMMLGVLEYILDVPEFIKLVVSHTKKYVIFSYWDIDDRKELDTKKWYWKNYYKVSEIIDMFGWEKIKELKLNRQSIVLLKRK